MTWPPSTETLNLLQVAMLLIVVAAFVRVEVGQRRAARIARDTRSEAARAATDARLAAETSAKVLIEIKRVGIATKSLAQGAEETAAVVASDLQAQHDRADAVNGSGEPGAAADAAAYSPRKETA